MKKTCNAGSIMQSLTSFPNQNDKHIDYVLVYEKPTRADNDFTLGHKKETARRAIFAALKAEKFDVLDIEDTHGGKTVVYSLLHCSIERLLEEAEITRLEMVLKNVNIKGNQLNSLFYSEI